MKDHLEAAEKCGEEPIPLPGGYVLEKNDEVLLIPQCCGDLSDIDFWRKVSESCDEVNWEGHPLPEISYKNDWAFFSCVDALEDFAQPFVERFDVPLGDLAKAVEAAEKELSKFEARLDTLLERLSLPEYAALLTFNPTVEQAAE